MRVLWTRALLGENECTGSHREARRRTRNKSTRLRVARFCVEKNRQKSALEARRSPAALLLRRRSRLDTVAPTTTHVVDGNDQSDTSADMPHALTTRARSPLSLSAFFFRRAFRCPSDRSVWILVKKPGKSTGTCAPFRVSSTHTIFCGVENPTPSPSPQRRI